MGLKRIVEFYMNKILTFRNITYTGVSSCLNQQHLAFAQEAFFSLRIAIVYPQAVPEY